MRLNRRSDRSYAMRRTIRVHVSAQFWCGIVRRRGRCAPNRCYLRGGYPLRFTLHPLHRPARAAHDLGGPAHQLEAIRRGVSPRGGDGRQPSAAARALEGQPAVPKVLGVHVPGPRHGAPHAPGHSLRIRELPNGHTYRTVQCEDQASWASGPCGRALGVSSYKSERSGGGALPFPSIPYSCSLRRRVLRWMPSDSAACAMWPPVIDSAR
jgi:hypothetical protein